MNERWALRLEPRHARHLADLRLESGIEVALVRRDEGGRELWVRGEGATPAVELVLRSIPGTLFRLGWDGRLTLPGRTVPTAQIPEADWRPLSKALELELPVGRVPAAPVDRVRLELVRTDVVRPAAALLTELFGWLDHAASAPRHRLHRWRFAAAIDASTNAGEALVIGTPLPSLPGTRLWAEGALLVPCGWTWRPQVDALALATLLGLLGDDVALLRATTAGCRVDRLPAQAFVDTSRSAARRTREAVRGTP